MKNKEYQFDSMLKTLCLKDKYELLEKHLELLKEVRQLRAYKATNRERYDKMSKALITYMDLYGSLDRKKGKTNGVHKQI